MKTLFSFSTLIVMAFLSYQAVQPEQLPAVKEAAKPPAAVIEQAAEADCREPILADRVQRARLEAQILASTARVRLETWSVASNDAGYEIIHSENHATVKDGRTLVTTTTSTSRSRSAAPRRSRRSIRSFLFIRPQANSATAGC